MRQGDSTVTAIEPHPETVSEASILIVDDDESGREALRRHLKHKGFSTLIAGDAPSAMEIVSADHPDLLLLDVMMPQISGMDLLTQLREQHDATQLPIIMTTALNQSQEIVEALRLGANDYVTKPLDFAVVLARIQTQLKLKRTVAQVLALERNLTQRNAQLQQANLELSKASERTRQELAAAAKVQEAFLPTAPPAVESLNFAWAFRPCAELAGDALNVFAFDAQNIGLYVLDASGHGVPAALLAISATHLLSLSDGADSILMEAGPDGSRPADPAQVAEHLNRKLAWNPAAAQFLTIFYAVLNATTRQFTYVSAGHPAAVRCTKDGRSKLLEGTGLPIGIGESYQQHTICLNAGDRVYLYSDGITEAMNEQRVQLGMGRLQQIAEKNRSRPLQESVEEILHQVQMWTGGSTPQDDISILAVELAPAT